MNSSYIAALETRARWTKWSKANAYAKSPSTAHDVIPAYEAALESDNIYFMNKKFCSLVDHARRTVPDDLVFDASWMMSRTGWLFLEEPFLCPDFMLSSAMREHVVDMYPGLSAEKVEIRIRAVGWLPCGGVWELPDGKRFGEYGASGIGGAFLCFHEVGEGYGMWSYFTFVGGDKLIDRIRAFENTATKAGGAYPDSRESDELHEMRWVYTAFYLMAQRLAVQLPTKLDRATRRRAQQEKRREPEEIRVISLRKLEAARKDGDGVPHPVDWQWQWEVRGHWRNQFYRAANEHRPVFIEAYIKGPDDKPLKAPGKKLFAAVR